MKRTILLLVLISNITFSQNKQIPEDGITKIIALFKEKPLIAIGETHGHKQLYQFLTKLVQSEGFYKNVNAILIESGKTTAVQRVTKTLPLNRTDVDAITNTAKAGELLGKKLIYLEAGSGATYEVPAEVIESVKNKIDIPLIVGGGIRTKKQIENAFIAGADMVVIGTAFEEDQQFFEQLK